MRYVALLSILLVAGCLSSRDGEEIPSQVDSVPAQVADTLRATLTGAAEVPEPGDPDGHGSAWVVLDADAGTVCFGIEVAHIATPTAAHLHRGLAGTNGPQVVDFDVASMGLSGCVEDVAREVIAPIREDPAGYYVNVHNAEHPDGAVRGQLAEEADRPFYRPHEE